MKITDYLEWLNDEMIAENDIKACMLRLDKIHPVVSGNKYFKLKYYLEKAKIEHKQTAISFGGYYSNHLHALAFACKASGINAIGYVRGMKPSLLNDTLKECIRWGMNLQFVPQQEFENLHQEMIRNTPPNEQFIPQGGYGALGLKGASEILNFERANQFDYIIAAAGTGTMGAGLLHTLEKHQQLMLISSVKNNASLQNDILKLHPSLVEKNKQLSIFLEFHGGGFAKKSRSLIDTMNWFFDQHNIPTDFIYTGKMIFAFYELLKRNTFPKKSNILLIHSGGIQGNRSLQEGILNFK